MNYNSNIQNPAEAAKNKAQKGEENSLTPLITTEGTPYEITEEGSLGILAMGYVGIMLWREKRYNSSLKSEKET